MGRPGRGTITTSQILIARERQRQALELRKGGASYDEIARALGFSQPSGAWRAIRQALKSLVKEPSEAVLQMELARLDSIIKAIWPKVEKGNLNAIDRMLRVMDRRAAYLGLDAPVKVNIESYIRAFAEREGLDPDAAIAEAQRTIREHSKDFV